MAKTISINPRREKISEYDRITSEALEIIAASKRNFIFGNIKHLLKEPN
jgi:hypothetical protein